MKNFKGAVIKPAFRVHLMQLGRCHLRVPAEVQTFTSGGTRFGGRRNTRGKGGAPKTRRWRECPILTHGSLVTLLLCLKNTGSHTIGGFLSEHPLRELSQTTWQWSHPLTSSAMHNFQTAFCFLTLKYKVWARSPTSRVSWRKPSRWKDRTKIAGISLIGGSLRIWGAK